MHHQVLPEELFLFLLASDFADFVELVPVVPAEQPILGLDLGLAEDLNLGRR